MENNCRRLIPLLLSITLSILGSATVIVVSFTFSITAAERFATVYVSSVSNTGLDAIEKYLRIPVEMHSALNTSAAAGVLPAPFTSEKAYWAVRNTTGTNATVLALESVSNALIPRNRALIPRIAKIQFVDGLSTLGYLYNLSASCDANFDKLVASTTSAASPIRKHRHILLNPLQRLDTVFFKDPINFTSSSTGSSNVSSPSSSVPCRCRVVIPVGRSWDAATVLRTADRHQGTAPAVFSKQMDVMSSSSSRFMNRTDTNYVSEEELFPLLGNASYWWDGTPELGCAARSLNKTVFPEERVTGGSAVLSSYAYNATLAPPPSLLTDDRRLVAVLEEVIDYVNCSCSEPGSIWSGSSFTFSSASHVVDIVRDSKDLRECVVIFENFVNVSVLDAVTGTNITIECGNYTISRGNRSERLALQVNMTTPSTSTVPLGATPRPIPTKHVPVFLNTMPNAMMRSVLGEYEDYVFSALHKSSFDVLYFGVIFRDYSFTSCSPHIIDAKSLSEGIDNATCFTVFTEAADSVFKAAADFQTVPRPSSFISPVVIPSLIPSAATRPGSMCPAARLGYQYTLFGGPRTLVNRSGTATIPAPALDVYFTSYDRMMRDDFARIPKNIPFSTLVPGVGPAAASANSSSSGGARGSVAISRERMMLPAFSIVYLDGFLSEPAIDLNGPLFTADGVLIGVTTATLRLTQFSTFLTTLPGTSNTHYFLIDEAMFLIASSTENGGPAFNESVWYTLDDHKELSDQIKNETAEAARDARKNGNTTAWESIYALGCSFSSMSNKTLCRYAPHVYPGSAVLRSLAQHHSNLLCVEGSVASAVFDCAVPPAPVDNSDAQHQLRHGLAGRPRDDLTVRSISVDGADHFVSTASIGVDGTRTHPAWVLVVTVPASDLTTKINEGRDWALVVASVIVFITSAACAAALFFLLSKARARQQRKRERLLARADRKKRAAAAEATICESSNRLCADNTGNNNPNNADLTAAVSLAAKPSASILLRGAARPSSSTSFSMHHAQEVSGMSAREVVASRSATSSVLFPTHRGEGFVPPPCAAPASSTAPNTKESFHAQSGSASGRRASLGGKVSDPLGPSVDRDGDGDTADLPPDTPPQPLHTYTNASFVGGGGDRSTTTAASFSRSELVRRELSGGGGVASGDSTASSIKCTPPHTGVIVQLLPITVGSPTTPPMRAPHVPFVRIAPSTIRGDFTSQQALDSVSGGSGSGGGPRRVAGGGVLAEGRLSSPPVAVTVPTTVHEHLPSPPKTRAAEAVINSGGNGQQQHHRLVRIDPFVALREVAGGEETPCGRELVEEPDHPSSGQDMGEDERFSPSEGASDDDGNAAVATGPVLGVPMRVTRQAEATDGGASYGASSRPMDVSVSSGGRNPLVSSMSN